MGIPLLAGCCVNAKVVIEHLHAFLPA